MCVCVGGGGGGVIAKLTGDGVLLSNNIFAGDLAKNIINIDAKS